MPEYPWHCLPADDHQLSLFTIYTPELTGKTVNIYKYVLSVFSVGGGNFMTPVFPLLILPVRPLQKSKISKYFEAMCFPPPLLGEGHRNARNI